MNQNNNADDYFKLFGYKVELCDEVTQNFQCPLCHFLLRKPVQTVRGHLACETCYREAIEKTGLCPIDNEPLETNDIFQDKFRNREILKLNCYCVNKLYGCPWKGEVGEVDKHTKTCQHKPTQCNYCLVEMCQSTIMSHLNTCKKFLEEGKCIFDGCRFKPRNAEDFKCHLESDVIIHTLLQSNLISKLRIELNTQLRIEHENAKAKESKLEEEIHSLKEQFHTFAKKAIETQRNNTETMEDQKEKIEYLEGCLHKTKESDNPVEQKNNEVETLSSKINVLDQNISDLKLQQQLFENTGYTGKILWKIDNISNRMRQAVNGNVTALHSAPTFTDRHGYKFCGRIYLNGDGVGRGTHISLFIVLMKSEYDNILSWPFNRKVTLRLVNQGNSNDDIKECFQSDVTSSSFKQPKKEMNIASGCPVLIRKETFLNGGFVKDDTAFIEISVS